MDAVSAQSRETLPAEDAPVFIPLVSLHLLALLGLVHHHLDHRVLGVVHLLEHLVRTQVVHVPLVQLQHVGDAVDPAVGLQQEGVLREEAGVDDPSPVVLGLEMRVREANEDLLQTLLGEVLTQMPHCVGPDHSDVVELPWVLDAVASDLLGHEVHHLVPDLHPEDQFVGEEGGEAEEQSSVAAADVDDGDVVTVHGVAPWLLVE